MKRLAPLLSRDPSRTAHRIALGAIAALAVTATPAIVGRIHEARSMMADDVAALGWVAVSTAALSVLLARILARARTPGGALGWAIFAGALAGTLDAGLGAAGVTALRGSGSVPGAFVLGCLVGGFYGAPLGAAYGATYAVVLAPVVRARLHPHHEAGDALLYRAGALLLGASVLGPLWPHAELGTAVGVAAAVAGGTGMCVAALRMRARRRLLAALDEGERDGLRSDARTGHADERALLPLVRVADGVLDRVLVASGQRVPYRGEHGERRLALLPSSARARRLGPANLRLWLGLGAACLAAGGMVAVAALRSAAPPSYGAF